MDTEVEKCFGTPNPPPSCDTATTEIANENIKETMRALTSEY